jgi:hypothetical protein
MPQKPSLLATTGCGIQEKGLKYAGAMILAADRWHPYDAPNAMGAVQ